jgi:endogenous inhibitor of DNA gyrase (YacG/DUF329 family)
MIQGRCPICSQRFAVATIDDLPSFPFCSDRCRLIDLGRWADGVYAIPAGPAVAKNDGTRPHASQSPTEADEA